VERARGASSETRGACDEADPRLISCIVLAAGGSRRLGRPKQLLELDGRPLLQHVIDAAAASEVDEILVVLGHAARRVENALDLPRRARVVRNTEFERGQATSLRTALDALDAASDRAVVLLGDQPRLPSGVIARALAAHAAASRPVLRTFWRSVPGHPVIVARSEYAALRRLSGDAGGRSLWGADERVARLELDDPTPRDVDTWDDYRALVADVAAEGR